MPTHDPDIYRTPERTAAEAKIAAVRERGGIFVEAVRATRVPMLMTDATMSGNPIIFANDSFLRLSGYSMEEVLGQAPHFLNGPETDPETIRQFDQAIAENRDETLEIQHVRKDGTSVWTSLFVSPLVDDSGQVIHHFLSFLDITSRREAETQLRHLAGDLERQVQERTDELARANRELTRLLEQKQRLLAQNETLLAEVSHRAKNSLARASSFIALQASRNSDPAVKALLRDTQERIITMAKVHDLLSKSPDPRRIDFGLYVRDVCRMLADSSATGEGRIEWVVDAEGDLLWDTDLVISLGLITNELLTNALKYAFSDNREGRIRVAVRRNGDDTATVSVSDNGVGMPETINESLGYQAIHALTSQIDGQITIDRDQGTTVKVTFPA